MSETLKKKRTKLLQEIASIQRMRRGQLSEQYYNKRNQSGELLRQGPYFVWQAWVRGKKRSVRVKQQDADQIRNDIEAYKQYKQLCEELADVTEELTQQATAPISKKSLRSPGGDRRRADEFSSFGGTALSKSRS